MYDIFSAPLIGNYTRTLILTDILGQQQRFWLIIWRIFSILTHVQWWGWYDWKHQEYIITFSSTDYLLIQLRARKPWQRLLRYVPGITSKWPHKYFIGYRTTLCCATIYQLSLTKMLSKNIFNNCRPCNFRRRCETSNLLAWILSEKILKDELWG